MQENLPDIPLIRTLFSRVVRVSFGFKNSTAMKEPFIRLYFDVDSFKMAATAFDQIKSNIGKESLRLSFFENAGEFLTLSFLWQNYRALFSSAPDEYLEKEYKLFLENVFYNDQVRLYFSCRIEGIDLKMPSGKSNQPEDYIPAFYYHRIP